MVEGTVVTTARDEILRRVRVALSDVPPNETPGAVRVPRDYRTTDPTPREELGERFIERV